MEKVIDNKRYFLYSSLSRELRFWYYSEIYKSLIYGEDKENVMFNKLKIVKQIVSLPKVKIDIIDTDKTGEINELYKYFTKPHPKYKIFKNKTLGVMLFEIPKNLDDYEKQITGKNSYKKC